MLLVGQALDCGLQWEAWQNGATWKYFEGSVRRAKRVKQMRREPFKTYLCAPRWLTTHCLSPGNWNVAQLTPGLLFLTPPLTRGRRHGWGNIRWSPPPASPPPFQYRRSAGCALILLLLIFITQTVIKWNSAQVFWFGFYYSPPD